MPTDLEFMQHAYRLAERAQAQDEVPVGAVVVLDNKIIGEGWNQPISSHDPSAHAEMVAMRQAAQAINNYRLLETTLYVTLEPCAMCVGAIVHTRIKRLVYGADDPKAGAINGAVELLNADYFNHKVEVANGVMAHESGELLRNFFKARR